MKLHSDCRRFERLLDRFILADGPLGGLDRDFFLEHSTRCGQCRVQAVAFCDLRRLSTLDPAPELKRHELLRLADELPAPGLIPSPCFFPMTPRWGWAAGIVLVTIGVLGWFLWGNRASEQLGPNRGGPGLPRIVHLQGSASYEGRTLAIQDEIAPGEVLEVRSGWACVEMVTGSRIFVEHGTRLRMVESTQDQQRLELLGGRAIFQVKPLNPGQTFLLKLARGRVQVVGTLFRVVVTEQANQIQVAEGKVLFTPLEGQGALVASGGVYDLDLRSRFEHRELLERIKAATHATATASSLVGVDRATPDAMRVGGERVLPELRRQPGKRPGPSRQEPPREARKSAASEHGAAPVGRKGPPPLLANASAPAAELRPSPPTSPRPPELPALESLLDRARKCGAQADFAGALQAYRQVIDRYPGSAEAIICLVRVGSLHLDQLGNPAEALRYFDSYLGQLGALFLAEEATWGRIKALHRLGRTADESRALRRFLGLFPQSLYAQKARARLQSLEGSE